MPITIRPHPDYIPAQDIGTRTEAVTQFRDLRLDISIRSVELHRYRQQTLTVASAQLMRLFVKRITWDRLTIIDRLLVEP